MNKDTRRFHRRFFSVQPAIALRSAEIIVPLAIELIEPKSVVDVGCGVGMWLTVFMKHGVKNILGIDGKWMPKELLQIPEKDYYVTDLENPLSLGKKFDLVVCLEVAEYLLPEFSDTFVDSLISLGNAILFSASTPNQGGIHRINEQWQGYWIERFRRRGYKVFDCIRPRIWNNPEALSHYKQNTFLFVKQSEVGAYPRLGHAVCGLDPSLPIVHPYYLDFTRMPLRRYVEQLPVVIRAFLRRRFGKGRQ